MLAQSHRCCPSKIHEHLERFQSFKLKKRNDSLVPRSIFNSNTKKLAIRRNRQLLRDRFLFYTRSCSTCSWNSRNKRQRLTRRGKGKYIKLTFEELSFANFLISEFRKSLRLITSVISTCGRRQSAKEDTTERKRGKKGETSGTVTEARSRGRWVKIKRAVRRRCRREVDAYGRRKPLVKRSSSRWSFECRKVISADADTACVGHRGRPFPRDTK